MFKQITLTCVLTSVLGSSFEPATFTKLAKNSLFYNGRIVGGVPIDIRHAPYQIFLEYNKFLFCGGSLITDSHVITAAHCLRGTKNLSIRVGSSRKRLGGTVVGANATHVYPDYVSNKLDYDVGIIVLDQKVRLSSRVKPISVAEVEAPVNARLVVSGWGKMSEGGLDTEVLRAVTIPVISREKCREMYKAPYKITNRMICGQARRKDSCQGDSGGPAVAGKKLYGIISWGLGCARPEFPGVYTNVADKEIRAFIREIADV